MTASAAAAAAGTLCSPGGPGAAALCGGVVAGPAGDGGAWLGEKGYEAGDWAYKHGLKPLGEGLWPG